MKKIKIFGERNTGTNYLEALIRENADAVLLSGKAPAAVSRIGRALSNREWLTDLYFRMTRPWNLGWKHGPAYLPADGKSVSGLCVITLTKNPYAWLLSLYKRPYHNKRNVKKLSFHEFLVTPWPALRRELEFEAFPSPVELWNKKVASYFQLPGNANVIHLRYEDILKDPESTVKHVAFSADVCQRKEFRNILLSTKRDSEKFENYRKYYLNESWKHKLDARAIMMINERLDPGVVEKAGYGLIET